MPLTPEQKKSFLLQQGLNPDEYDVVEEAIGEEADGNATVAAPPEVSGGTAFKERFKSALIPGAVGLAGMSAGSKIPGPWPVKALGAIGLGIAGNFGADVGQSKILEGVMSPEDFSAYQTKQTAARTQHPYISQVAEFIPNLAAFSPASLPALGGGLSKLLLGAKPAIAETAAMAQTGVNAAVGGGLDVAKQKFIDKREDLDLTETALATLLGGAAAKPYGPIGRKLFPQPVAPEPPPMPPRQKGLELEATKAPEIDPEVGKYRKDLEDLNEQYEVKLEELALKEEFNKGFAGRDQEIARPPVGNNKEVQRVTLEEDAPAIPAEGTIDDIKIPTVKEPSGRQLNDPYVDPNKIYKDAKFVADDDPNVSFQPGEAKGPGLTPEQLAEAKAYATKRGVSLEALEEIISTKTGQPARGSYKPSERRAAVSNIATPDTPYHEIGGHAFPEDLARSASPKDRAIVEGAIKRAGNEEALAEFIGRRIVEVEGAPVKSWLQDFAANVRRVTGTEDNTSALRHLARRAKDDRPYAESPELHPTAAKVETAVKPQDTGTEYSEGGPDLTKGKKELSGSFVNALRSPIIKLKESANPFARKAAAAGEKYFEAHREYLGKFQDSLDQIISKAESPEMVGQWLHENRFTKGQSKISLSPRDQQVVKDIRQKLIEIHNEQRAIKRLVGEEQRQAKDDPHYSPSVVSSKVMKILSANEDPAAIAQLKQDYINHQMKQDPRITQEQAKEMLNSYLRNLNNPTGGTSPEFGAVVKQQGVGLPYSWVEKDPRQLFRRYTERIARDFALHKAVLSDPETKVIFNYRNQFGKGEKDSLGVDPVSEPALGELWRAMTGEHGPRDAAYQATEAFARGAMLGTLTGLGNHASAYGQALVYVPARDIPKLVTAWKDIAKGLADSFETGVNRRTTLDIEVADNGGPGYWTDKIRHMGNNLRKWQGANAIEQITRGLNMMQGELVAQAAWSRVRAGKGGMEDLKFLRKFDGTDNTDFRFKEPTPEAIKKLAARFVERIQGTYDARGVPSFMLENSSPFFWIFNLAKWSAERSNIVKQDVFNPLMKDRDFGPLLKFALGGVLSGAAIEQIRETFNNRKGSAPNFTELSEEGDLSDWVHKFIELNKFAGSAGIVGDALHYVSAKTKGLPAQSPGTLGVDVLSETAKGATDVAEAIANGEAPMQTLFNFAVDTIVNNVQAARVIRANTTQAEVNEDKDKRRDLRVYKQLTDKPVSPVEKLEMNPYIRKNDKEFKRAKSMDEAKKIAEEKIKPSLEGKTPEERKRALESLKGNSYQTIPSDRKEAKEYLDFISRTQGEESSAALAKDKKAQDLLNRRKNRLLPRR